MGYYLGLDMGTNSVGWAVTDKEYKLLRAKGKDLWGIREFEEASTSVDRRTKRVARRRHQREQARLGMLKSYFDEEIMKTDELFFVRLDNSKYFMEDKDEALSSMNCLFDETNYTDKDYFKEYPTVFHLRHALMNDEVVVDDLYCRKVYLALANMFKHRGHFLEAGLSDSSNELPQISTAYASLLESIDKVFGDDADAELQIYISASPDYESIKEILGNKKLSRSAKKDDLMGILDVDKKNKKGLEVVKAICGLKFDCKKLFPLDEIEEKLDLDFTSGSYDDNCETYHQLMGDEYYEIIECLKSIFDIGVLSAILGDYQYLSDARIASYEEHARDLKVLKKVIKKYNGMSDYDAMFRSETDGSYSAYVKSYNSGAKDRRASKGRTKADLYATIKKLAKNWDESDEEVKYIVSKLDTNEFLPKQLTGENGVIPNQVHTKEMKKILDVAKKYLAFLNDVDESGYSVADRIVKLFSFHIPYYIGPVTEKSAKDGGNGWVVRKETGRVLPWNLEDKIDTAATSQEFIMRMVRDCTYIAGEKVLPKESLMYQKFAVLNEINNIRIRDEKLSVEQKQDIYNTLFKKGKRVTKSMLCKYLKCQNLIGSEDEVSGVDTNINNYLGTYGKFLPIFGDELEKDSCQAIVEDIVRLSTIFGDSKKFLRKQLEDKYSEILDETAIKRILGLKFKDWGKLSKEFLQLEGCDENGEIMPLIGALWSTNYNMMELINADQFAFKKSLEEKQVKSTKCLKEFTFDDLDDYYFSAPVKRMIWQTLKIINELEEVLGEYPEKVFVEMTRRDDEKGDKGRKESRKKQFSDLYKNVRDESNDWAKVIEDADQSGVLRSKKMYLYLTQMGKCMYCGQHIDLDRLFTTDYDIDHIYPRSQVKDDNLSRNMVLAHKHENNIKQDCYPITEKLTITSEVRNLWSALKMQNFITEEKYKRLTGNNKFTDEQRADFIARQLVETSQGTKGVADLLKQLLPESCKIVYAKAAAVSEFRRDNKETMTKSRLVNDFHHANDAYLNIVVGNVYYTKFTQNPLNYIKKEFNRDGVNGEKNTYHLSKMFDWNVKRGDEVAWIAQTKNNEGTIATVKAMMARNTPLMTRMSFEAKGGFANETLYGASVAKEGAYIPFKSSDGKISDVTKYGGFSSVSTAYFFLVEHTVKGKRIRTIECVPVYLSAKLQKSREALQAYCENELGLEEPSVRLDKINVQSLIEKDGYKLYLSGKTSNQFVVKNAVNMIFSPEWNYYVKKLEKEDGIDSVICSEKNIILYDLLTEKHTNCVFKNRPNPVGNKLKDSRRKFIELTIENQKKVLLQIFNLSVIGNTSADLSLLDQGNKIGTMRIQKKISDSESFYLINQSVTGIYENYIDLLKV